MRDDYRIAKLALEVVNVLGGAGKGGRPLTLGDMLVDFSPAPIVDAEAQAAEAARLQAAQREKVERAILAWTDGANAIYREKREGVTRG